jgi:methanogenic corrinoid protein MtbC1
MIKWLIDRQDEGLRISHAVDLWNELTENGQDPLLVNPVSSKPLTAPIDIIEGSPKLNELRNNWINACLNFDELAADNIANYAFALYPAETVCFEILLEGLSEVGKAWYEGKASVQQEHFISSLIIRRLNTLIAATPLPIKNGRILVSCPPGEQHTIAPLMISFMLRQRGWDVVDLGANVPEARFEETIRSVKPLLVVMTAQNLLSAANLMEVGNYLARNDFSLAYGGRIFSQNSELQSIIPGHYLGDELRTSADRIEEILQSNPEIPETTRAKNQYKEELEYFVTMRPEIEAAIGKQMKANEISTDHIDTANRFLSQIFQAIIKLGNPNYMKNEIAWVNDLLVNSNIKPEILNGYLSAYYQTAKNEMDDRGKLVIKGLSDFIELNGGGK